MISLFIFFNSFAVNMLLQYRRVGRWRDYLYGERRYIVLSLVAKSALAWQMFFGTMREANDKTSQAGRRRWRQRVATGLKLK